MPARPAPRAGNPAQAARLRGQGLAAMNGGAIDRAVALLRQALALDPDNSAIRSDLNRALRVQSIVHSRH
jgi:Flp pilus assembly protein TadD